MKDERVVFGTGPGYEVVRYTGRKKWYIEGDTVRHVSIRTAAKAAKTPRLGLPNGTAFDRIVKSL